MKKTIPSTAVNLVINNSPPRSLRFLNNASLAPVKALIALSALAPCKRTIAINKIDTIIKAISKLKTSSDSYEFNING